MPRRARSPIRARSSRVAVAARRWEEHLAAGERVEESLDELAAKLAELPGGSALLYLVEQLRDDVANTDQAASLAVRLLDAEVQHLRTSRGAH